MSIKIGICNFCCPGTGVFAPQMVSKLGLDGMSIEYGPYEKGFYLSQQIIRDYYKEAREQYGIEYSNIGFSDGDNIPLFAVEGEPYYEAVDFATLNAVDAAVDLGVPMVFFATFNASLPDTDEKLERMAKRFQKVCDYAAEKDIVISWENPLSFEEQKKGIELVDRKNFNLFYDSDNYKAFRDFDQVDMLTKMYPYMGNVLHVKDSTEGIGNFANAVVGTGVANFKGTADFLKEKGYEGWVLLENLYEVPAMNHLTDQYIELMEADVKVLKETFK